MDKALKQRLVGAIVLIALAVIVLPMIFGGRSSGDGSLAGEITLPVQPPDLEFETRRFPIGDQTVPEADDPAPAQRQQPPSYEGEIRQDLPDENPLDAEPGLAEQPSSLQSEGSEPNDGSDPDPAESQDPIQDPEAEPLQAQVGQSGEESRSTPELSPADSGSLRYVVQVASFGSTQNATRLAGQLEEAGYAVLLDHVSSDTAQLNRVRVGPYGSEAAAQTVARELRDQFSGINPRIVDLQPEKTSPVVAGSDPLVRWVVQVGSFGSEENAVNLVARLQASGLSAFDEAVTTDTSTIYRVRVGPFLDREEALLAEQQIGRQMGIDGVVMSAD